jgi:hypothetical protein
LDFGFQYHPKVKCELCWKNLITSIKQSTDTKVRGQKHSVAFNFVFYFLFLAGIIHYEFVLLNKQLTILASVSCCFPLRISSEAISVKKQV